MNRWIEIKAPESATMEGIVGILGGYEGHAFQSEPWHPGGYVVRIHNPSTMTEQGLDAMEIPYQDWDASPDEELFGDKWPEVSAFFTASTKLGDLSGYEVRKLVHCFLNTRGYSWHDEIRFHAREVKNRIRLLVEMKLHVGPRYRSWKAAAEQADSQRDLSAGR